MYKLGSNTEIVRWSDIEHLDLCCLADLYRLGWNRKQIDYYLGNPDFVVRQGAYNTGAFYWWRAKRVRHWAKTANIVPLGEWRLEYAKERGFTND